MYAAGLSFEKSAGFLSGMLGREIESFVTIWQDVQSLGEKLRRNNLKSQRIGKRDTTSLIVGIDGAYVRVKGETQGILLATNMRDGARITVSLGNQRDEKGVKAFVKEVAKSFGVPLKELDGIVSDDLDTYKLIAEKEKLVQQICLGHAKKNLKKRVDKLKKKIPISYLEKISSIFDKEYAENGKQLLEEIGKDPKLWKMGNRINTGCCFEELSETL